MWSIKTAPSLVTGLFLFLEPLIKLLATHHQRPSARAHVRVVVELDSHGIAAVLYLQLVALANAKAGIAIADGRRRFANKSAGFGHLSPVKWVQNWVQSIKKAPSTSTRGFLAEKGGFEPPVTFRATAV
jgi:hypothetical protein